MVNTWLVIGGFLLCAAGASLYAQLDSKQMRERRPKSGSTKIAEFDMRRLGPAFMIASGIVLFLNGTRLI